jgi:hypothetical protein
LLFFSFFLSISGHRHDAYVSRVLHAAAATPLIRPFNSRDRVVIIIIIMVVVVMATSVSISVDDVLIHGSGRRRHGSKAGL